MLARLRLIFYALPAGCLAALGLPVMVLLPTAYAEDFGLGLGAVAIALLAARLVDVVTDPLIGLACDRSGWSRRVWVLMGLPLMLWAGWHLFRPALPVSMPSLMLWSILFSLGITLITVPYQAWGAEMTDNEDQRLVIASAREGCGLIGVLGAMVAFSLASGGNAARLADFFPPLAVMLTAAVLTAVVLVAEPPPARPASRQAGGPVAALSRLARNRPFLSLLGAQAANGLANALPATLFLAFVDHRLERPDATGPLLLLYFGAAIFGIPLWWRVGRRLQKRRAWRLSLALTTLAFAPSLMLSAGDVPAFAIVCLLTGLGLAGDLALPAAILAETIHEQILSQPHSSGAFYVSLWALFAKLSLALAVGIAFPLLQWSGMTPDGSGGGAMLVFLYAGLPILLKGLAVWLLALKRAPVAFTNEVVL